MVFMDLTGMRKCYSGGGRPGFCSPAVPANPVASPRRSGGPGNRRPGAGSGVPAFPATISILSAEYEGVAAVFHWFAQTGSFGIGEVNGLWVINGSPEPTPIPSTSVFGSGSGIALHPCPAGSVVELNLELDVFDPFDLPSTFAVVPCPEPAPRGVPVAVPKPVVVTAGAAAGAGLLWWLGKALSPACGPAVLVCAVVL